MVTELITAISECNCPGSAIISINPEDYHASCLMSSSFLLPVQILRIEKKIPITKRTTSSQHGKKKKTGLKFYLTVRPWASGWLPFTMGWEMGKTAVDKNCLYLPSASPLPMETAPSLPRYYGYHRSQQSRSHTVATADWFWSIHLTQAEPIKIFPTSHFGPGREKAVTLQMVAFPW